MQKFLEYEAYIRTANKYCNVTLGDSPDVFTVASAITDVKSKLSNLKEYIDSYGKLRLELVGSDDQAAADKGTITAMIREYTRVYHIMHDLVQSKAQEAYERIREMAKGDLIGALASLDRVDALHPEVYNDVISGLGELGKCIFSCSSSSRADVERSLRSGPEHETCKLTFINAERHIAESEKAADDALVMLNDALARRNEVFLNAGVR